MIRHSGKKKQAMFLITEFCSLMPFFELIDIHRTLHVL